MVGFSKGLVGFLWKSDGAYNIFANDRESIENLAKYAYSLFVFPHYIPLNNISVYCFTKQNVISIKLPKNVLIDLNFIERYLNAEIVFFFPNES